MMFIPPFNLFWSQSIETYIISTLSGYSESTAALSLLKSGRDLIASLLKTGGIDSLKKDEKQYNKFNKSCNKKFNMDANTFVDYLNVSLTNQSNFNNACKNLADTIGADVDDVVSMAINFMQLINKLENKETSNNLLKAITKLDKLNERFSLEIKVFMEYFLKPKIKSYLKSSFIGWHPFIRPDAVEMKFSELCSYLIASDSQYDGNPSDYRTYENFPEIYSNAVDDWLGTTMITDSEFISYFNNSTISLFNKIANNVNDIYEKIADPTRHSGIYDIETSKEILSQFHGRH